MKKWIAILGGLLVVQLVLAVAVNLGQRDYGAFEPQEDLLTFEVQAVDGIRIESGDAEVMLTKQGDQWRLPERQGFPANENAVEQLLTKLAGLKKGWPVATSASAADRFKVAAEDFERKVSLLADGQAVAELYVGSSPGFRKVHVRPAGEDAVYSVAFSNWEASAKEDDWIDKGIVRLDEAEITRLVMPGFVLQRQGEAMQVADLAEGQQTNSDAAGKLVRNVARLRIQNVLGAGEDDAYGEDSPALELTVERKEGEGLTYRFFQPKEADYYVLKRSDLDYSFKVAGLAVKPIIEMSRDKLVSAEEAERAEETAGNGSEAETQE